VSESRSEYSLRRALPRFAVLIAIYLVVVFLIPKPEAIKPAGWRLAGVFFATVIGLMIEPIPGGACVLLGVTLAAAVGALTIGEALGGYSDPTVWMVIAAFLISRALIKTGMARRIALFFIRSFGQSTLGIAYSLAATDTVLASVIPSNAARAGGVVLPIARAISELYGSLPGPTSALIGTFLYTSLTQTLCVSAAMFLTGQAGNPLAADMARQSAGISMTWSGWLLAGLVPGLLSLAIIPLVVMKLHPPGIKRTPEAAAFAAGQLRELGPMSGHSWIVTAVFAGVCLTWATSGIHKLDIALTALLGSGLLLATGVITWEDVKSEKSAWDIFVWYGGLVRLAKALNDAGVTTEFAKIVGGWFGGASWEVLFALALLVYFYTHYAFASITAHLLAMYPPFLMLLKGAGAPMGLVCYAFAAFANFAAGLTHYGTTPQPMFFSHGYITKSDWLKTGLLISFVNLTIWSTVGFAWWKFLGIW